ncbi:MAG: hypothetical protein HYZ89_00245 [Candidatus Omnitrophica bacterium]|nr:hypothetical protein [Candidatus Omnitrophota bacterium]
MVSRGTPVIGYAALTLGAIAVVAVVMRLNQGEVGFCREAFQNLVNGNQAAQRQIDWERLTAVGADVGKAYTQLSNDQARAQYRKAFVNNFAIGFQRAEGSLGSFRNWRVHGRDGERVVVAADYEAKHKTLLLSIPASGQRKLEAIQWQNAD